MFGYVAIPTGTVKYKWTYVHNNGSLIIALFVGVSSSSLKTCLLKKFHFFFKYPEYRIYTYNQFFSIFEQGNIEISPIYKLYDISNCHSLKYGPKILFFKKRLFI